MIVPALVGTITSPPREEITAMSIIRIPQRGELFRFRRTYLDGTVGTELGECASFVYSGGSLVAVTNYDDRTVWVDQIMPPVDESDFREFFEMSHGGSTHECAPECTAVKYPTHFEMRPEDDDAFWGYER